MVSPSALSCRKLNDIGPGDNAGDFCIVFLEYDLSDACTLKRDLINGQRPNQKGLGLFIPNN